MQDQAVKPRQPTIPAANQIYKPKKLECVNSGYHPGQGVCSFRPRVIPAVIVVEAFQASLEDRYCPAHNPSEFLKTDARAVTGIGKTRWLEASTVDHTSR